MKNVRIKTLLLTLILSISQFSFAKSEFLPGYIINIQGDTIQGFISYDGWDFNPDEILFKPGKMRTPQYYLPIDIQGFGLQDKRYVSGIVQKETSPYLDRELLTDPALRLVADTVFLQTLIGGDKSLHYLRDWDEKEHFYIQEDSIYKLLLHKTYVEYKGGRKEYHNMRFLGQLSRYFWEESLLQEVIASTSYDRSSLEHLFTTYLNLQGKTSVYRSVIHKVAPVWGVVAGISSTILHVDSEYFIVGFGPSINFTGGFSVELAMAGRLRDLSFCNELLYSSYKMEREVRVDYFPTNFAKFDFDYIRLNTMIRYRPSWFFVNAGFSNGLCIHQYNTVFEKVRSYEIGLVLGAGLKYKNFSMEYRKEIGDGISSYVYLSSNTSRAQILLNYSF